MSYDSIGGSMKKILFSLYENARKHIMDIAKEVGLDRTTVSKTIKKLEEDDIIWGYKPTVDARKLDLNTFLILMKFRLDAKPKNICNKILANTGKNHYENKIIWIDSGYLFGDWDVYMKFLAKDMNTAHKYMISISQGDPGLFKDIILLCELFPIRICGEVNPNLKQDVENILI